MIECYDLIVVGGGAAGLVGGILAGRAGLRVLTVERMEKAGRKILATGGGRCNLTRDIPVVELLEGYYGKKNFIRTAIYDFQPESVIEFFKSLGLDCIREDGGGVYPASQKAVDVFRALVDGYVAAGGELALGVGVEEIRVADGAVSGVFGSGVEYRAKSVLIAGGGCSMKELGSDGSAFELARRVGHRVVQPCPGLVGLVIPVLENSGIAGISLQARVSVGSGKSAESLTGDILFTHKGLSGPVILDISRFVSREIADGLVGEIVVSWGARSKEEWKKEFLRGREEAGKKNLDGFLGNFFAKSFVGFILGFAGVDGKTTLATLKKAEFERLLTVLGECRLEVARTEGFAKSMVTSGGVDTAEINRKTMESRVVGNLYFAGEVLDVDGRCGGYNLEWAFASAKLAVKGLSSRH